MWLFGRLARRKGDEKGQGLAEYALMIGLIAVVAITALMFFGQTIASLVFDTIGQTLGTVL